LAKASLRKIDVGSLADLKTARHFRQIIQATSMTIPIYRVQTHIGYNQAAPEATIAAVRDVFGIKRAAISASQVARFFVLFHLTDALREWPFWEGKRTFG
jgi:hypothetical protein